MSWSGVVEPPAEVLVSASAAAAKRKEAPVERYGCAQKQELREIFGTIFDRQLNSSKPRDLHIRIVFETNQMEDSSSACPTTTTTTTTPAERSIGSTAGVTPLPQSPLAITPTKC